MLLGTGLLALVYALLAHASEIHTTYVSPAGVVVPRPPAAPGPPLVSLLSGARQEKVSGVPLHEVVVAQHSADLNRLLEVSWVVLILTALGSALLGWFAAGRVLRPLRTITATARTISAGNMHQRLALAGPDDEFKQLGDTLDDLLARLETSFDAQRRFVANASHELRTPLTLERTLLQVALADPNATAESLRATCEELLANDREQERLLEALLTLASSERGLDRREQIELAMSVEQALPGARRAGERLSLRLAARLEPAPISGDRALIDRLIANLLDNAVRYNEDGGRIELETRTDGGRALLTVANSGPAVPPTELERLFEPFQRLNAGRSAADGHHGLGLSIVRAIVAAHGAGLDADAQPAGGLRVTVSFPAV